MKKIILFLFVCFTFEVMYAETKEVCLNQDQTDNCLFCIGQNGYYNFPVLCGFL